MSITQITEINELLTKALKRECYLEDNLKPLYMLKFPSVSSVSEFEAVKDNCERFLSRYDITIGATSILYPEGASKVFVLQINRVPINELLEKLAAISKDLHDEAVQSTQIAMASAAGETAELTPKDQKVRNIIKLFSMPQLDDGKKVENHLSLKI